MRNSATGLFLSALRILFLGSLLTGLALASQEKQRKEEAEDYFEKWLTETVTYIISEEERAVFKTLTTDDEKEQFIEQFWYRRDPDKRTPINEFKTEHYRRIAYSNEHFTAGWPGWKTDRGRIYIVHGPPDEIEDNPSGGEYERTLQEGGGNTSVFPFQKWRYRNIENVGSDVVLEFVDRDFSGVFRLALSPEEKDAFMFVPNAGFTMAEQLGMATRGQRPYFAPHATYPLMNYRARDSAFARYETYAGVLAPKELKYPDLKEIIEVDVSWEQVPFTNRVDGFRLNDERFLASVTLEVQNRDITFKPSLGGHEARVAIYGVVNTMTNRLITEFEDEVTASFSESNLSQGLQLSSAYNRILLLDVGRRYKLQLVVKDLNSSRVGARASAIVSPTANADELTSSPLIVSGFIAPAQDESLDQMFVLGDVQVRPSLTREFDSRGYFAVYLQIYNVAIDQSTLNPSFGVRFQIRQNGETVVDESDEVGTSVQYFSPERMVLIKRLSLEDLQAGDYEVAVVFTDRIRDEAVTATERIRVTVP